VHDWSSTDKGARFMENLHELNSNDQVSAILVQFPLGHAGVDAARVMETVDPEKDVDGFHPLNMIRLLEASRRNPDKDSLTRTLVDGTIACSTSIAHSTSITPVAQSASTTPVASETSQTSTGFESCTAKGVMRLLAELGVELAGERVCVVGRSRVVGWPLTHMLLAAGATVTVCHSQTRDLPAVLQAHRLVVVAIGQARFVQASWIRPGAVVIDVGINEGPEGSRQPVGDVDYEAVRKVAAYVTPVPGGVGPLTVAMLAENVLRAAEVRSRRSE
jgi:methylenetetrahydrofolate dehydrogenase (NADP+)/methenyltetrahydrofolate cyclohydrolase